MSHLPATRGVVFIHSAPAALCPHVEWAIAGVLGGHVSLEWTPQPAQSACYRAELSWQGDPGTRRRWPRRCADGSTFATRSPKSRALAVRASATRTPRRLGSSTP